MTTEVVITETPLYRPAETPSQSGVITQLGMPVERQMVGEQTDVMVKQGFQASLAHASHPTILATPEPAMMNQQGVSALGHCGVK